MFCNTDGIPTYLTPTFPKLKKSFVVSVIVFSLCISVLDSGWTTEYVFFLDDQANLVYKSSQQIQQQQLSKDQVSLEGLGDVVVKDGSVQFKLRGAETTKIRLENLVASVSGQAQEITLNNSSLSSPQGLSVKNFSTWGTSTLSQGQYKVSNLFSIVKDATFQAAPNLNFAFNKIENLGRIYSEVERLTIKLVQDLNLGKVDAKNTLKVICQNAKQIQWENFQRSRLKAEKLLLEGSSVAPVGSEGIGFEELHRRGYYGEDQNVVVIEPGIKFAPHPAFDGKDITLIDVGREPEFPPGFQDRSTMRYKNIPVEVNFAEGGFHAQKITSILIGHPSPKDKFPKGICPEANITLVSFSHISTWTRNGWVAGTRQFASTAIYPFKGSAFAYGQDEEIKLQKYLGDLGADFSKHKIDDSILDAFRIAFQSNARVITGSFNLQSPTDFRNYYKLTDEYLDFLANGLENNDKILVFSAGNFAQDITAANQKGLSRWDESKNLVIPEGPEGKEAFFVRMEKAELMDESAANLAQIYFEQYAQHPILKERVLIVVNAITPPVLDDNARRGQSHIKFSNGREVDISLAKDSCYPGSSAELQAITVGALGSDIIVATDGNDYKKDSGTSFAVPIVGGLLVLMDQHYKSLGQNLTGPELVRILKKTCILPGPDAQKYYGNGLIDPMAFCSNPQTG